MRRVRFRTDRTERTDLTRLGGSGAEFLEGGFGGDAAEFEEFVPGLVTANDLDAVAGAIEFVGEELDQRLVGGGIHGRGGDFDFQFVAGRPDDLIGGGAGLEFDGEEGAVWMGAEIIGCGHGGGL